MSEGYVGFCASVLANEGRMLHEKDSIREAEGFYQVAEFMLGARPAADPKDMKRAEEMLRDLSDGITPEGTTLTTLSKKVSREYSLGAGWLKIQRLRILRGRRDSGGE